MVARRPRRYGRHGGGLEEPAVFPPARTALAGPDGRLIKEPLCAAEMRRPFDMARACEAQVRSQRGTHLVNEPGGAGRVKAVLPPEAEHLDAGSVPVDSWFDPADKAVAEDHWKHVPAPSALRRREEAFPHVFESEQAPDEGGVP